MTSRPTTTVELDANVIIGDTVHNPERVKPLRESDCRIPIPKPNFFIVGSAKSGSTTLTAVLSSHPDCCHSAPKETNFFTLNFDLGLDWYRGTFAHYNGEPVIGEASVSYCSNPFRPRVVDRLYEYNPDAKILYIVRHPYEKLVSGWKMATSGPGYVAHESAMKGFEAYVLHEERKHAECGEWTNPTHEWESAKPSSDAMTRIWLDSIHYQGYVDDFRKRFPEQQIKVMLLEDWKANPQAESAALCEFLDLDPDKLPPPPDKGVNRADQRKKVRGLAKFLADSNVLGPLRRLFPVNLRRQLRRAVLKSPLGSKQHVYPEFRMSDEFRDGLQEYLRAKSAGFLASQGKPVSFWNFDQLGGQLP